MADTAKAKNPRPRRRTTTPVTAAKTDPMAAHRAEFSSLSQMLGQLRMQAGTIYQRMAMLHDILGRPADLPLPGAGNQIAAYQGSLQGALAGQHLAMPSFQAERLLDAATELAVASGSPEGRVCGTVRTALDRLKRHDAMTADPQEVAQRATDALACLCALAQAAGFTLLELADHEAARKAAGTTPSPGPTPDRTARLAAS